MTPMIVIVSHGCQKNNITQINNCRRYIWILPQYVSTFHWNAGLLLPVNKQNISQIIVSVKNIDMKYPAIRSHIRLFNSPPRKFSTKKYKLNMYLDNIYFIFNAIRIQSWLLIFFLHWIFPNNGKNRWEEMVQGILNRLTIQNRYQITYLEKDQLTQQSYCRYNWWCQVQGHNWEI